MKRGITLIDVVFAVVILGILSAIVIPRLSKGVLYNKHVVYTTARQVGADMRLARRLAITNGVVHRVICSSTGGSSDYNEYRIQKIIGSSWVDVGEPKSIPNAIIVSGSSTVSFNPNGSANAALQFRYIIDSYRYQISITMATGTVSITTF